MIEWLKQQSPEQIALQSAEQRVSYGDLINRVESLAHWLQQESIQSVVIRADNSIDWVVFDIACMINETLCTPIPLFFSETQVEGVIADVQPDLLVGVSNDNFRGEQVVAPAIALDIKRVSSTRETATPEKTQKITFTSGSTGHPKGVCLSVENQMVVARSLIEVTPVDHPRHLSLLPLPTLLENIAGIFAPLMKGGTVILASEAERGFMGSRLSNPQALIHCISVSEPNTMILVPELLLVLVHAVKQGWTPPSSLQFIAVGGSKVSPELMIEARAIGLPVFQGYGLSECASVVSLSTSLNDPINSVGHFLPHIQAEIIQGELNVRTNNFLGYLNNPSSWNPSSVATGDLVEQTDGQVYIKGRKKNLIINSFGRNISPEWVESEILATGLFLQVVILGDARPFLTALLIPVSNEIPNQLIENAITRVNQRLPDYAKVQEFIINLKQDLDWNTYFTANGRPKRQALEAFLQSRLEQIYQNQTINSASF